MHVKLHDVAHTPLLSYNLISLPYLVLKGHTYAGDKNRVTLKLKGRKIVHFPLIGKLCRQYGYPPEAKSRVVDTACAVIAPGQAKAPTSPSDINTFHCTYGHTDEVLPRKTAEQQEVNLNRELHECRGCSMAKGLRKPIARSIHTGEDTLCPSRAPTATAPVVEEGDSTAGEGASGEGTSNQDGGRMEDLNSESDLDNMMEVWPPVPPATREALAAEPGAGAAGVRKATPRHLRFPPGEPVSVVSTAAVAAAAAMTAVPAVTVVAAVAVTTAVLAVTAVTATTAETFPHSWGDLRGTWMDVFGELPRTAKWTHEVPVAGRDHERVLRGYHVGVCDEGRGG